MATDSYFSDIPLNFIPHPVTGDIPALSEEKAVKAALINLLRSPVGEIPFNPEYGTNIEKFLFEPADTITEYKINQDIAYSIKKFEPRVSLISVETKMDDQGGADITITYYVKNVPGVQTLETTLTRA
jgi:phage baseplate assembly protein W